MGETTLEDVNRNLERLTKIVVDIQEHLQDSVLTSEEEELLDECLRNENSGSLTSAEDLKTELGI